MLKTSTPEPISIQSVFPARMREDLAQKHLKASMMWHDMFTSVAPPTITLPELHGNAVVLFVLPSTLCKTTNEMSRLGMVGQSWRIKKYKQAVYDCMAAQCRPFGEPLKGRPQILCCKFGGKAPDRYANFGKVAVDRLLPSRRIKTKKGFSLIQGLNIISDDSTTAIEEHQWWYPAKREDACLVIQVRTGEHQ